MTNQETTGPASEPTTYNLLFVCTGNTCRSPLAESIARRAGLERGWSHLAVRSAGIAAFDGAPASSGASDVARAQGLDLSDHSARSLTRSLVDWADLILVMSVAHLMAVRELGAGEKAALITEFVAGDHGGSSVEDPFGGDDRTYRRVFDQLEEAVEGTLARLAPILAP